MPLKQELAEVDKPGLTSTDEEDLPGQFSADSIRSHRQALKGHEQVAVMFFWGFFLHFTLHLSSGGRGSFFE